MSLVSYLSDRKLKRIHELMMEHAGRCKAVGRTFQEVGKMIATGNKGEISEKLAIIKTEEKSADHIVVQITKQVALSNLPDEMSEELLSFIRTLDRAAGAAKRSVTNLYLIKDYSLPLKYAEKVEEASNIINDIFIRMEVALKNLNDMTTITSNCNEIDNLESKMDLIYQDLKNGYFEIEKSFKSAAALIILDHAFRDLESSADFGEDAAELLISLVSRKS